MEQAIAYSRYIGRGQILIGRTLAVHGLLRIYSSLYHQSTQLQPIDFALLLKPDINTIGAKYNARSSTITKRSSYMISIVMQSYSLCTSDTVPGSGRQWPPTLFSVSPHIGGPIAMLCDRLQRRFTVSLHFQVGY